MSVRLSASPPGEGQPIVDHPLLRRRAQRLLAALGRSGWELSISLLDDARMRELNRRWRGRRRATDVLSFSLLEGERGPQPGRLLGDVVIGVETAQRRARARHRGLDEELARLLIHGTLHLLGHDHQRPRDARAMRAEERRLRGLLREAERAG